MCYLLRTHTVGHAYFLLLLQCIFQAYVIMTIHCLQSLVFTNISIAFFQQLSLYFNYFDIVCFLLSVFNVQTLAFLSHMSGLEIRVVLWPQSTRTSGGPPAISMWWSGGLLKLLTIKKQYFDNKVNVDPIARYFQVLCGSR